MSTTEEGTDCSGCCGTSESQTSEESSNCPECCNIDLCCKECSEGVCPINVVREECIDCETSIRESLPWDMQNWCEDNCGESLTETYCPYWNCSDCSESSSVSKIVDLFGTLISVFFCTFVLGFLQNFDSKGPLYLTLIGSCILAISLSGIRIKRNIHERSCKSLKKSFNNYGTTTLGWFTFVHSHHCLKERVAGHEFKIGDKYFCTGCFGILIGTVISIVFAITTYFIIGLNSSFHPIFILIIPFCFIPIILRYTLFPEMKSPIRLLSNILLPIGCCLLFFVFENTFHNWFVNVSLILVCITIAFLRGMAQKVGGRIETQG